MTQNTNQPQQPAVPQPAQPEAAPQTPGVPQQPAIPQPVQPQAPQQPAAEPQIPQQPADAPQTQQMPPQGYYYDPANQGQPYNAGGYYGAQPNGFGQMPPQGYYPNTLQAPTPTAAIACGVASLVCLFFMPPIGIAVGIVAIVLASKHAKRYGKSTGTKVAKICGIVGTILSALFTVLAIAAITALLAFSSDLAYDEAMLMDGYSYEFGEGFEDEFMDDLMEDDMEDII